MAREFFCQLYCTKFACTARAHSSMAISRIAPASGSPPHHPPIHLRSPHKLVRSTYNIDAAAAAAAADHMGHIPQRRHALATLTTLDSNSYVGRPVIRHVEISLFAVRYRPSGHFALWSSRRASLCPDMGAWMRPCAMLFRRESSSQRAHGASYRRPLIAD